MDSAMAIHFVKEEAPSFHPCGALLDDIKILASCMEHTNFTANTLAEKCQNLSLEIHIFDVPTPEILSVFKENYPKMLRRRGIS
ncbi:hypothetical protein AHAS_Ahas19G0039500 [Arachis hypogaea]